MKEIRYIGRYQPKGMIAEVEDDAVDEALETGNYELASGGSSLKPKVEKEEEEEKPNKNWTEMKIYNWIKEKKIPVKYKPVSDKKVDILKKLKDRGHI